MQNYKTLGWIVLIVAIWLFAYFALDTILI